MTTFIGTCGKCGLESDDRTEFHGHTAEHREMVCVFCMETFWSELEFVWHCRLHETFHRQTVTDADVDQLLKRLKNEGPVTWQTSFIAAMSRVRSAA